jgi:hypothetical protein
VFGVDHGLGVVCLDVGAVAVLRDPRVGVGVGEVGLGLGLGTRLRGGRLAGVGDGLLIVGAGSLLSTALLVFGVRSCFVGGFGLDLRAGGLQPGQAFLAPVALGRQVGVLAVDAESLALGFVGGQQGGGLGFQASASIRSSLSTRRP